MKQIDKAIKRLREYTSKPENNSVAVRKKTLRKLYHAIRDHEQELYIALNEDFKKPVFESYVTEIGYVLDEIRFVMKHIARWSRTKRVSTPLHQFPASSFIKYEPYGVVLIMAPWNYPFQLIFSPLIGALAAGNSVLLKPSEFTPKTAAVIEKIVNETFDPGHVSVVTGGVEETTYILRQNFDYIFFTGSTPVGKIIMKAAAENLTPVTLELGGKSPVIVDSKVNIKLAARRIAWGKFINSGQTCVAPDYCFVHESHWHEFLEALKREIIAFYGMDAQKSQHFARIINKKHYQRIKAYLKDADVLYGGKTADKELFIEPTLLDNPSNSKKVMKDEIFGPVLPLIRFSSLDDVIKEINKRPKPLALYIFSDVRKNIKKILGATSSGGVTINDTIVHLSNPRLPFGGVGPSGMGAYHGRHSLATFSHAKSVMRRGTWLDLPFRYPPYMASKLRLIKQLLK